MDQEKMRKLLEELQAAAVQVYDDCNDAGQARSDTGIEFDSFHQLRKAIDAAREFLGLPSAFAE